MNIAIILSGGRGCRLKSDIPKQYIEVSGKCIISYSLISLFEASDIDKLVIVSEEEYRELIKAEIEKNCSQFIDKFAGFANPGVTRQMSIYNALLFARDVIKAKDSDLLFIHDAARPNLSLQMISEYINAIKNHDGLIPVLPMKDTIYLGENGSIMGLLDRNKLFAGQAPELFLFEKYMKANEALMPDKILKINGTTEVAVLAGLDVAMVPGNELNFKITTKEDLERFKLMVEK